MKFSFHRHHKESLYHHAFHVYRDWTILLVCVVVLSTISVMFHAYMFYNAQDDSSVMLGEPTSQLTVDREQLKQVMDSYAQLETDFELKKQGSTGIVDPSV